MSGRVERQPERAADPGKGATTREQRYNARKQAWKRPTRKADRDALRAERVAAAKERMPDGNRDPVRR